MSNILKFKSRTDKEFEFALERISAHCAAVKKERCNKFAKWVFQTTDGFIKIVDGNQMPPRRYYIPKLPKIRFDMVDDFSSLPPPIEKMEFELIDELSDGSYLFMEVT